MQELTGNIQRNHKLSINGRKSGAITGVADVLAFDEQEILLETEQGMLMIKGMDLHVQRLSLEKGEVDVEGRIDSLTYSEINTFAGRKDSLLSRLFR